MIIDEVREIVKDIPYMTVEQAKDMTDFILKNRFRNILELGFEHGVSTCYIAAALDEQGEGQITTIDLDDARSVNPNIETLLGKLNLKKYVTVYYEPTSYIWRLLKMIEEDPSPRFDFCYIDGAHTWFVDGFAFYLVDRLLVPGGWIIFDDLDWTFDTSPVLRQTEFVKSMPLEERTTPQIRKVYELIVKPHPAYGNFLVKEGWAYARKSLQKSISNRTDVKTEVVYEKEFIGLGHVIQQIGRKIARLF